jgi:hypothetical protein
VGDGGAAAATAATSTALLDPDRQLISGLRQRLLAYLYKGILSQSPCDVAPNQRDFQHNFAVLSSMVVWRARLLGRHQLLLKMGAPTRASAAVAESSPNRTHFFGVYNLRTTRFTGFWKGTSSLLLSTLLEQPCKLLAASRDLSPLERCCATALYPAGFPIGLDSRPTHHQQQQKQQQQPQQQVAGSMEPPSRLQQRQQQQQQGVAHAGSSTQPAASRTQSQPCPATAAAAAAAVAAVSLLTGQQTQHRSAAAGAATGEASAAAAAAAAAAAGAAAGRAGGVTADLGGRSDVSVRQRHSTGSVRVSESSGRRASQSGNSSSSSASVKERLKLLQQVVLMVLPGLQVGLKLRFRVLGLKCGLKTTTCPTEPQPNPLPGPPPVQL